MTHLAFIDMDGVIAKIDARLAVASLARIAYYESVKGTWEEVLETPEAIKQQAEDIYWQTVFNPEYVPLDELIEGVNHDLLVLYQQKYQPIFFTSRPESMREATELWMIQHLVSTPDVDDILIMKHPSFQRTPTPNWKAGMLHSLALALGAERVLYIDDERKNWNMMVEHSAMRNGAYSLCYYPSLKEAAAGLTEHAPFYAEQEGFITPKEGMRVIVRNTIDRDPFFSVPIGTTGVVTCAKWKQIHVQFDLPIKGVEEWDNEIRFTHDDLGLYGLDDHCKRIALTSWPKLFTHFFAVIHENTAEDSTEYRNDLSGHNQEIAWQKAQEAYAPSDAQIQAEAERLTEQTEDDVLVSQRDLSSDEQMQADFMTNTELQDDEFDVEREGYRPDLYTNEEMYAEAKLQADQVAAEMNYRRNVLHEDDGGMCY